MKLVKKQILGSTLAAAILTLSMGLATVPASAKTVPPTVASQCTHPGFAHFGFATMQECLKYVAANAHQQGNGYGGNTYNINTIYDLRNFMASLKTVSNSVINLTINLVTNVFHN
ncbi:MAG TPA: hypothetical protein VNG90_01200 [Candidatus Acidoferrum sp.]|nr:hypothetical protein [Candidatus Acidoferrum sp.]